MKPSTFWLEWGKARSEEARQMRSWPIAFVECADVTADVTEEEIWTAVFPSVDKLT